MTLNCKNRALRVTVPYHNKDLRRRTSIVRQAGLTREEFHEFLVGKRKR